MKKILVFAGTTEGRTLVELLQKSKEIETHACVATQYGGRLLTGTHVHVGRLTAEEMKSFMESQQFQWVVDATHPYAAEVSRNIKGACQETKTPYLRLLRPESQGTQGCVFVKDTEEAVQFLNQTTGTVLLTTGSKELAKYTQIKEFEKRLFARVLPSEEVVQACSRLGFSGKQLLCMQGPFDYEMNKAMLKWLGCDYIVTKDSGREGGTEEKLMAARDLGVTAVIIGRPFEEEGMGLDEVLTTLEVSPEPWQELPEQQEEPPEQQQTPLDWFPLFVNFNGKQILSVGGGQIATRRISTLMEFNCNVTVVAPQFSQQLTDLAKGYPQAKLRLVQKGFEEADLAEADYVITATDRAEVNDLVVAACKAKGIPVNAAHRKEACDFFFPAVIREGAVTVGLIAQGKNHQLAKEAAAHLRRELSCLKERL